MRYILRLGGRAKHVFAMLAILATTEPLETDQNWWTIRAWIIATDRDKQPQMPIEWRNN